MYLDNVKGNGERDLRTDAKIIVIMRTIYINIKNKLACLSDR